MVKRRGPPSQGWRTFLRSHAPDIAAMDLFDVPTICFDLLYAFVIVRLGRRDLVWINVTANPTAATIKSKVIALFMRTGTTDVPPSICMGTDIDAPDVDCSTDCGWSTEEI
jgi:hypothetical protein